MDEIKKITRESLDALHQTQAVNVQNQNLPKDRNPLSPPQQSVTKSVDEKSPHLHRGHKLNTVV